jgi:hypothetical protein
MVQDWDSTVAEEAQMATVKTVTDLLWLCHAGASSPWPPTFQSI